MSTAEELRGEAPSARQPAGAATDLGAQAVRGGLAKVVTKAIAFAIRIGSMMVVTRLLDPRDFGLVAMVGAVTGIFTLLRDAGLGKVTVQRESMTQEQLSTLFWINTALGGALAISCVALGPVLVAFYREPRLLWISVSLGLGFLLNALGVQHAALLQRQMRFTAEAIVETAALVASTAVAIVMAALGFGYWALVGSALVLPAVTSAGSWLAVRWVPGRPHRGVGLRSMMRFGGTVTLNSALTYVAYNMDKVLLGRFAGAEALGIYGRAYQLVNIPTENLNGAIGVVAFSALSRLQGDAKRFRSYFLKGYSLVLSVTLPITVACGVLAPDIVHVALGPKWTHVVPLLRLLAPTILAFAVLNPTGWLLLSRNLVGRSMRIAAVIAPCVVAAYLVGLPHGAHGVALAFSGVMVVLAVPLTAWAVRETPVSLHDVLDTVRRPLLAGLAAGATTMLALPVISRLAFPLVRLLVGSSLLFAVYAWVLLYALGQKAYYLELFRKITGRSGTAA